MIKNIIKVGLILSIFVVLSAAYLSISDKATQRKADAIYFTNYKNVVKVEKIGNSNLHGTGVVLKAKSGRWVILTNHHVCKAAGDSVIIENEVMQGMSKVVYSDRATDLCILEGPEKLSFVTITLADEQPRVNEEVYSLGYPADHPKTLLNGRVVNGAPAYFVAVFEEGMECLQTRVQDGVTLCLYKRDLILTSIPTFGGSSGSPVFNNKNELVGLLSVTSTYTQFGSMIYLKDIQEVLNKF